MSKTLKLVVGIALFTAVVWSCKNETEPQVKTVEVEETTTKNEIAADATLAKAEFSIEGMTCAIGCAKTIEKKLSKMDGVKSATVDFDKKLAMVEYDEAKVTTASLEETVTKTSDQYTVSEMKTVESFTTDGAKKACCAGKDKKECKTKCSEDCTDKDCTKCAALKVECKKACDAKKASCKAASKCSPDCTDKDCAKCAAKKAECQKKCDAKKASCKGKSKKECKSMKGDKASKEVNKGEKMAAACGKDCKEACCSDKA